MTVTGGVAVTDDGGEDETDVDEMFEEAKRMLDKYGDKSWYLARKNHTYGGKHGQVPLFAVDHRAMTFDLYEALVRMGFNSEIRPRYRDEKGREYVKFLILSEDDDHGVRGRQEIQEKLNELKEMDGSVVYEGSMGSIPARCTGEIRALRWVWGEVDDL